MGYLIDLAFPDIGFKKKKLGIFLCIIPSVIEYLDHTIAVPTPLQCQHFTGLLILFNLLQKTVWINFACRLKFHIMHKFVCLTLKYHYYYYYYFMDTSQYNHKLAKNQQHWNSVEKTISYII